MSYREEARDALRQAGLGHLLPELEHVVRPAIELLAAPGAPQPVGGSRLGGSPDLPPLTPWPHVDGVPLMFVGQIRLEDLAHVAHGEPLPDSGLLSFFFDGMLTDYDRGECPDRSCVLHTTAPASMLVRRDPPADVPLEFRVFESTAVTTREVWTLPAIEEIDGHGCAPFPVAVPIIHDPDDGEAYEALRRPRLSYTTRLLGHPDEVQGGEVRFDLVTSRDGGARYRYEDFAYTNAEALADEIRELVLLLQSTTEEGSVVDWGGGAVMFWISRSDLAAGRFDTVTARLTSG